MNSKRGIISKTSCGGAMLIDMKKIYAQAQEAIRRGEYNDELQNQLLKKIRKDSRYSFLEWVGLEKSKTLPKNSVA